MKFLKIFFVFVFVLLLTSCQKKGYTIYVNYGNEYQIEAQQIKEYSDIKNLQIPNIMGYIPNGWFIDSNFETPLTENTSLKDINVIYLKWSESSESKEDLFLGVFNKALENHFNSNQYEVITQGNAKTSFADQSIYSKKIIDDDNLYLYNSSYGTYAKTFVELQTKNNLYLLTKGEPDRNFKINKVTYKEQVSLKEYLDVYGVNPKNLNYLITKDTVKEVKTIKNDELGYAFIVELKEESALDYKKYIIGINNLPSENVRFQNISLTIRINSDFYFETINYDETYKIDVMLSIVKTTQTITNKITDTFTYTTRKEVN